jgi:hypothetical protein
MAVARKDQIVCPLHSEASASFMIHADREAHLTLQDQPLTCFMTQHGPHEHPAETKAKSKKDTTSPGHARNSAQKQPRPKKAKKKRKYDPT